MNLTSANPFAPTTTARKASPRRGKPPNLPRMTDLPAPRWTDLRRFTAARVALGRAGSGVPTAPHLAFQAAHAAARDAVHAALDVAALRADLAARGIDSLAVHSQAADRRSFLLRPDLGRRLRAEDAAALPPAAGALLIVAADGLSAAAVQSQAPALIANLVGLLRHDGPIAPVVIAEQARVALGDAVGEAMAAEAVAVLIGERPGLSAPESLGVYLTWQPRRGRTDAERNCISNIRDGGVGVAQAAQKLAWLIRRMRELRLTGTALKDEHPAGLLGA